MAADAEQVQDQQIVFDTKNVKQFEKNNHEITLNDTRTLFVRIYASKKFLAAALPNHFEEPNIKPCVRIVIKQEGKNDIKTCPILIGTKATDPKYVFPIALTPNDFSHYDIYCPDYFLTYSTKSKLFQNHEMQWAHNGKQFDKTQRVLYIQANYPYIEFKFDDTSKPVDVTLEHAVKDQDGQLIWQRVICQNNLAGFFETLQNTTHANLYEKGETRPPMDGIFCLLGQSLVEVRKAAKNAAIKIDPTTVERVKEYIPKAGHTGERPRKIAQLSEEQQEYLKNLLKQKQTLRDFTKLAQRAVDDDVIDDSQKGNARKFLSKIFKAAATSAAAAAAVQHEHLE